MQHRRMVFVADELSDMRQRPIGFFIQTPEQMVSGIHDVRIAARRFHFIHRNAVVFADLFNDLPNSFAWRHAFRVLKQVHLKKIGHPIPFLRDGVCLSLTPNAFLFFFDTPILFSDTLLFLTLLFKLYLAQLVCRTVHAGKPSLPLLMEPLL